MMRQTFKYVVFGVLVAGVSGEAQTAAPPTVLPGTAPAASSAADTAKMQTDLARARRVLQDWPNLARYRDANAQLAPPSSGEDRVVFMGDSIFDGWGKSFSHYFPGKPYIGRGIGGQTTPQMLVRFRPDVVDLHPKVVVILAGTNDIAGNTGPETLQDIENNLESMAQLARANGIRVVLSGLTPVCDCVRPQTDKRPPAQILAVNDWLRSYAAKNGFIYLDYHAAMVDDKGMMQKALTIDGLHPNPAGYAVMAPLTEKAIAEALGQR
jgi:lysophospholipase L1-like esterase